MKNILTQMEQRIIIQYRLIDVMMYVCICVCALVCYSCMCMKFSLI